MFYGSTSNWWIHESSTYYNTVFLSSILKMWSWLLYHSVEEFLWITFPKFWAKLFIISHIKSIIYLSCLLSKEWFRFSKFFQRFMCFTEPILFLYIGVGSVLVPKLVLQSVEATAVRKSLDDWRRSISCLFLKFLRIQPNSRLHSVAI